MKTFRRRCSGMVAQLRSAQITPRWLASAWRWQGNCRAARRPHRSIDAGPTGQLVHRAAADGRATSRHGGIATNASQREARCPAAILLADDNPAPPESLWIILRPEGHQAEPAHDGVEARVPRSHDMFALPGLACPVQWVWVAQQIRAAPGGRGSPADAITGWA
jgi:hypothetical protein